jgi:hypothetical protein
MQPGEDPSAVLAAADRATYPNKSRSPLNGRDLSKSRDQALATAGNLNPARSLLAV